MKDLNYCRTTNALYISYLSFAMFISVTSLPNKSSFRARTYSDNIAAIRYNRLTDLI